MKIETTQLLIKRASKRKDGVYIYGSILYAVKDNIFIAYADYFGNIYRYSFGFMVKIGACKSYDRRKELLKLIQGGV